MTTPSTSDVVVIGGGIVGLSCAFHLARAGVQVSVLERGRCGQEASWAGAGVLQCGSWHRRDPLVQLLRTSVCQYGAFCEELRERTRIDPEYIACGGFDVLLEDQQYRMAVSEVRAAGEWRDQFQRNPLELLTPEQARELEPNLTGDLLGVKYCPVSSQVRNPRLMAALEAACRLEGVHIVEQCEVGSLTRDGSRVTGVLTSRGPFAAGHVVLAAGPWSSQVDPELRRLMPVLPVRGQIVLLEARPRLFARIIERGRCYLVPRLDGRIVVGATQEHDVGFEKRNTAEGIHHLLTLSQRMVPSLASATLVRTWAGLRPGTPDDWPFLGPVPGMEGLLAAAGHFRSGLILAPLTGRIIADLVTTGRCEHDLSRYAPGRDFRKKSDKERAVDPSAEFANE